MSWAEDDRTANRRYECETYGPYHALMPPEPHLHRYEMVGRDADVQACRAGRHQGVAGCDAPYQVASARVPGRWYTVWLATGADVGCCTCAGYEAARRAGHPCRHIRAVSKHQGRI